MIEINYVPIYMKINHIFFVIKGQFPVTDYTRVIFYVRRIGLYLYKYRIYGTISIYVLNDLAFVYQLI